MSSRFEIFSGDLTRTAEFYTAALGFRVVGDRRDDPDHPYLVLERDSVRIGVSAGPPAGPAERRSRRPPVGVEIVVEVDDVRAEYERVLAAGRSVDEALQDRSWGLRDFRLTDPDGYYLRVTDRRGRGSSVSGRVGGRAGGPGS